MHLEGPSTVGLNIKLAKLTHDGDSDLGVERDLVSQLNALESRWLLDWVVLTEKSGKHLTDAS